VQGQLRRIGFGQLEADKKFGAFPGRTVEVDAAVLQLDELLGDGQPQPRAPELAVGRSSGLGKAFKDQGLFIGGNAHAGIRNGKLQHPVGFRFIYHLHRYFNMAFVGKLNGIADQVVEDLA
jgi:hypothetical protein